MLLFANDATAMAALGASIATHLQGGEVLYLQGELGTGKTTFVRGLLHALGYSGKVKSPTYNLIEPYSISGLNVYHFDLYRINNPEELEEMGIRDYCDGVAICLFEWPERSPALLPVADITLLLSHANPGRTIMIESSSALGDMILEKL